MAIGAGGLGLPKAREKLVGQFRGLTGARSTADRRLIDDLSGTYQSLMGLL
jgi:hypothetical protein